VVAANVKAVLSETHGEVFNVGGGQRISINQLVSTLNDILETDIEPVYGDPRPGDVKHSQADISKAKRLLGYEPDVDFETGLGRLVERMRG
jgi:nucleoside-diphosphate-sugar epimerase